MVRFAIAAIVLAASLIGVTASAQQLQLLDFWSPQCGPCMQMKPIVHSYEQAGYPIRAVDTTRDGQLSQQYGVSQIPCFVMLVNGKETERQVGAIGSDGLKQMFERAKAEAARQNDLVRQQNARTQSPDPLPRPQADLPVNNAAAGPAQPPAVLARPKDSASLEAPAAKGNLASSTAAPASHAALLSATVRLIIEDAQGRSFGTGTIVDTRSGEALVVTCAHLFRETQGKAPVKADLYEGIGDGVRLAGHATGQVLSFDLKRDIALVSLRVDRPVGVVAVAPPRSTIERGDRMVGVGCSHGQDPTVLETRVTSLDRYQGPPNIEASGAPEIGRSGGGLFNGKNELVGVCNNADPEGNEGIYAGLESIHDQLDRLGLKEIYAKSDSNGRSAEITPGAGLPGGPPLVRLQEPSVTPLPNDLPKSPAGGIGAGGQTNSASPARNLSETEQAALEEIMSRAVSSEVIFIVRPKDGNGQCEVIHMDSVSPEFLRALRQRSAPPTTTR
jgi:thiol-disulfide isomerase/thioredoxin